MSDAFWFTKSPEQITKEHLGLDIHPGKLRDLADLADGDIGLWYLLSLNEDQRDLADDLVNLLLGPLAVAMKDRGLGFRDRHAVISPTGIVLWLEALQLGLIPKQIRKDFDAALVARFNSEVAEMNRLLRDHAAATAPDFPVEAVMMAVYRDWFEPTRYVFYRLLTEFTEPLFEGPSNSELEAIIDRIMADNPTQVEKARAEPKLIGWFIGQVNKVATTKLDPAVVRGMIENKLK